MITRLLVDAGPFGLLGCIALASASFALLIRAAFGD